MEHRFFDTVVETVVCEEVCHIQPAIRCNIFSIEIKFVNLFSYHRDIFDIDMPIEAQCFRYSRRPVGVQVIYVITIVHNR